MDNPPEGRTDLELVAAANGGEREAFEALYYRYRGWIYALACRFCRNEHDAHDVIQDAFFYFFNKFPGFKLRCQLKTFLYPAVKHLALNRVKKTARSTSRDGELDEIPAGEVRDEDRERRELLEVVQGLPEAQREVVILRFADGLDLREIADAVEVPLGTVKSRLHHALRALRSRVEKPWRNDCSDG